MNSSKFSYKGQIEIILHYLDLMIQKNWTGKTADEFNHLLSIPELAKIACMSVRNLQLMFKAKHCINISSAHVWNTLNCYSKTII